MEHHIIAILGKVTDTMKQNLATYTSDLNYLKIADKRYINATHCLLENLAESHFTLIGTKVAIDSNRAFAGENCEFREVGDERIEDIFNETLESIKNSHCQKIILDVTHGFRFQPIVASFASVLGQINHDKSIEIIYAIELDKAKNLYRYISLEKYMEKSLLSLQLQSFHQRLVVSNSKNPLINSLANFCKYLHSNDFNKLFIELNKVNKILESSDDFSGLENVLEKVRKVIMIFNNIKETKEQWKQYYKIASLMKNKGYYLIAIAYVYEAIPRYVYGKLKENGDILSNKNNKTYDVVNTIKQAIIIDRDRKELKDEKGVFIHKEKAADFIESLPKFNALNKIMSNVDRARNDAAHINTKPRDEDLGEILKEALEFLKNLK